MWDFLYDYVLPLSLMVASTTISLAIPILTPLFFRWLKDRHGVEIEESRQRMFQTGLENAAQAVLRRAGNGRVTDHLIDRGVTYLENATPDQIEHWNLDSADLRERVANRVAEKQRVTPALVVTELVEEARLSGRAEVR